MVIVITLVGSISLIGDEGGSLIGAVTVITLVGSVSATDVMEDEGGSLIGAVTVITLVGSVSVTDVIEDELLAVVTVITLVGSVSETDVIGDERGSILAVVTVIILFGEPVSTAVVAVVIVLGAPGWCEGVYILSGLPVEAAVDVVVGGRVGSGITIIIQFVPCASLLCTIKPAIITCLSKSAYRLIVKSENVKGVYIPGTRETGTKLELEICPAVQAVQM